MPFEQDAPSVRSALDQRMAVDDARPEDFSPPAVATTASTSAPRRTPVISRLSAGL
jgi:hypothetical protein